MKRIRCTCSFIVLTLASLLASGCQLPMAHRSHAPDAPCGDECTNYGVRNPWVIGGITAAALAVPLALDD